MGARRVAGVAAVDAQAVVGEHDLTGGVRRALDADEDVGHASPRMRAFSGSNSGVASAAATVTG